jgi:4,5-DOPA dioxygenase extradiol
MVEKIAVPNVTMPAAFFGHGSPLNTLDSNAHTRAWRQYGSTLARPRAILVISAHWYTSGIRVTAGRGLTTIHDFNARFPRALFEFRYAAPIAHDVIGRIEALLSPLPVEHDMTWGIDHGAFSVLAHVFPHADIPMLELSLDRRKSAREHYELARRLAPLRDEGVFIMGSGNIVHNLEIARFDAHPRPYEWATRFQSRIAALVEQHDHTPVVEYARAGDDARLCVPTPDHYLPLLYVLAQQRQSDVTTTIVDGFDLGAVGMLSLGLGG